METRANHIWVGAVTMILLAALAAFIIWLARLNNTDQNEYDIFFKQSVDGLARGSEVAFSGVPAGQIKDIELWQKDPQFVRVRVKIDRKIPILQGTTASIQGSFTGVSTVQLDGAVRGAPPITQLGPEGVPVIPTRRGGLGELLSNAPLLLERLATLTERLTMMLSDKNQASIEGIDRALNQEGAGLAEQLKTTLASAQKAADELQGTLGDARPAARQLSDKTLPAAEAALRDLRATSQSLRDVTDRINDQGAGGLISGPKLPDYKP